jgi:hypothetical protein
MSTAELEAALKAVNNWLESYNIEAGDILEEHAITIRHALNVCIDGAKDAKGAEQPVGFTPVQDSKLIALLKKLACLGNGDMPGNSIGNVMAQEALEMAKNPPYLVGAPEREPRKVTDENLKSFLDDIGFSNWCCGCDNKSYDLKKPFTVLEIEGEKP